MITPGEANSIAFIKKLHSLGYTNKQIFLITRWNLNTISRIVTGKTYKDIFMHQYHENEVLEQQKNVLDRILQFREIPGAGYLSEMDKAYIRIIKLCGGKYEDVREIYSDRPISDLRPAWDYANQNSLDNFDSNLIGIDQNHFAFFIEGVHGN